MLEEDGCLSLGGSVCFEVTVASGWKQQRNLSDWVLMEGEGVCAGRDHADDSHVFRTCDHIDGFLLSTSP